MVEDARAKWNRIYTKAQSENVEASWVLTQNAHLLPPSGSALDLACGVGGDALFLAQRGLQVTACDISHVALAQLAKQADHAKLAVICECLDLEEEGLPDGTFDVVVVSRFLCRRLADGLIDRLNPGGLLFYQTYTRDKLSATGPQNPEFLLEENELLTLFGSLRLRFYREEGRVGDRFRGLRDEAYFVGQKASS